MQSVKDLLSVANPVTRKPSFHLFIFILLFFLSFFFFFFLGGGGGVHFFSFQNPSFHMLSKRASCLHTDQTILRGF